MFHRIAGVVVLAGLLFGLAPAAQVAAATATWITQVADPTGVDTHLALGSDGVHHIAVNDQYSAGYGGTYSTDRGNRWITTTLNGWPRDIAVDSAGHVFIVVEHQSLVNFGPRLSLWTDAAGSLAVEDVPGSSSATHAALVVSSDGSVDVAWSSDGPAVSYETKAAGVWGDITTVTDQVPSVRALTMSLDGDGVAHVVVTGTISAPDPKPAGCDNPDWYGCTVDIAFGKTPTTVGIASILGYSIDSTTGADGAIEAVVTNDTSLEHLSSSGGTWTHETIATGNITHASISRGPTAVSAFYAFGNNTGLRRADATGSAWTVTTLDPGPTGPIASGVVDSAGRTHLAFTRSSNHASGGFLPTTYLMAPDLSAPVVSGLRISASRGKVIGSTIPSTISWSTIDAGSGVARYQIQMSTNGTTWTTVSSTLTTPSLARNLTPAVKYWFRVRGTDRAGNTSPFVTIAAVRQLAYQQNSTQLKWAGSWHTASSTAYWAGSTRYASSTSASASVTFTGMSFSWVSTYGPTRGSAKIYVDGTWIATVDTHRSGTTYRVVAYTVTWAASGVHTVMIKPAGTAGHARIDLDAFIYAR